MTRPILIVDGLNVFIRSYCAYPTMSSHGYQMGGTVGFLKTMTKLINENQPSAIYIAWEGGGSSKRRSLFKEYKQNRKPEKLNRFYEDDIPDNDENRIFQITVLIKLIKDLPFCQLYTPDCEGDDVISYIYHKQFRGVKKIIVSSDKDFYQLLDENTNIYNAHKKSIVTQQTVLNEYRISPQNFALAKCVCGDTSDNIPGIEGVGFKTAVKHFPMLGSRDSILLEDFFSYCRGNIDESKYHRKVVENIDLIKRNWKLIYLDSNMLSQNQSLKIDNSISTFKPALNRMNFIKTISDEGIGDFDFASLFSSCVYLL